MAYSLISIEHGIYLDDEAIALKRERGTYQVPTLAVPLSVLEAAETTGAMPEWGIRQRQI